MRTCRATVAPPPFISVIVPVRNEAAFIHHTLEQLLTQNYDPGRFEVLVADGRSADNTAAIVRAVARRHPNLRLLHNRRRWSSAGRNVALAEARGDLVVVVDGHCELDNPNYLRDLADAFARSGAACVGRPQPLDVTGATALQKAIAVGRASPLGHHPASFIYSSAEQFVRPDSVAVAYRREVFEQIGLFDESFDACEDVEFNHRVARAGLKCFFTPRVAVRYYPRATLRGLFKQMARYGRGRVRLLKKHPETFGLAGFLPAAFALGLVAGPLLAWFFPACGLVYGAAVLAYAALVLAVSMMLTARARDVRLLPWLPLVFPAIHLGAGFGILQELTSTSRKRRRRAAQQPTFLRPRTMRRESQVTV